MRGGPIQICVAKEKTKNQNTDKTIQSLNED